MIIQSTETTYELIGKMWLAKFTYQEMNFMQVLHPLLHSEALYFLRQHQTFALLNPEE